MAGSVNDCELRVLIRFESDESVSGAPKPQGFRSDPPRPVPPVQRRIATRGRLQGSTRVFPSQGDDRQSNWRTCSGFLREESHKRLRTPTMDGVDYFNLWQTVELESMPQCRAPASCTMIKINFLTAFCARQ